MVQIASKAFHGHRGIQIATQRQNLKGNEAIFRMSPAESSPRIKSLTASLSQRLNMVHRLADVARMASALPPRRVSAPTERPRLERSRPVCELQLALRRAFLTRRFD